MIAAIPNVEILSCRYALARWPLKQTVQRETRPVYAYQLIARPKN